MQILVPVLALALVALRFELTRPRRALAGGAFLLTLAAIGYTGSRGAIVAMALMLVAGLCIGVLRMRHAVLAALLGVALVLAIPGYRDRVQTIIVHPGSVTASAGDDAAADDSARARATESLAALLAWEDHPLLGAGPGVFPLLYQQYAPRVGYEVHIKGVGTEAGQAPTREAHNLYLGTAADTGLLRLGGVPGPRGRHPRAAAGRCPPAASGRSPGSRTALPGWRWRSSATWPRACSCRSPTSATSGCCSGSAPRRRASAVVACVPAGRPQRVQRCDPRGALDARTT